MMPELKEFDIGKRVHPTTKIYLMENPFPKKKKKKKKKGKKKKKWINNNQTSLSIPPI